MDFMSMAHTERGAELAQKWSEKVVAGRSLGVAAAPGVDVSVQAFPDLLPVIMKFVPIITALLAGGFTPAALLALVPEIIRILLPNLDDSLVELLQTIIAFFVNK